MNLIMPLYPDIRVELHTHNPYALVSAIRLALRRSRVDAAEISRFTEEALARDDPAAMKEVCSHWAEITWA